MDEFYVYTHTKIGESIPFYVGKGKGNRAYVKSNRSVWWKRVAAKGYQVRFVVTGVEEHVAHWLETHLVSIYGRRNFGGCLLNHTNGGEGISGWIHSDNTREKLRSAWKRRGPVSEETRNKMSDARRKNVYTFTSPEGINHIVDHPQSFCRERGLNCNALFAVCRGSLPHYKLWRCKRTPINEKR